MPHVIHTNAALLPKDRLEVARLIVDHRWTTARAARHYNVSWATAAKWARRYASEGTDGMGDRTSAPRTQPRRTPPAVVRNIVRLRLKHRLSPVEIGARLHLPASTVHAVLVRCRLNRLSRIDRPTAVREKVCRYEHPHPGSMLHVDVKKLPRIPDGGGHRHLSKQQGTKNTRAKTNTSRRGTCYLHTVIDDHSRIAYVEAHNDEKKETAAGVLRRAVAWFNARGVTIERVLSDNGSAYRSHHWRQVCHELGITHHRTRPYRPQTNGKIERFHRTLAEGWAHHQLYLSENARLAALPSWLHHYNHHRPHSAIGKVPPITRLNNVPGQHS